MRKIGLVKKKYLTRERIYLIIDYLLRHEKQHKWTRGIRNEWTAFMEDVDRNVDILLWQLSHEEYEYGDFIEFNRIERGKLRKIFASHPVDQIVDQLLTDCLYYVFLDKKHIVPANCYGSIPGKGQHEMRRKIIRLVKGSKNLIAGIGDTKQYYPTMLHDLLYSMCERHIKDKWLLWLCKITIYRMKGGRGLALGSPSSNIFGHLYHSELDWLIILGYKVRRYYRFCDNKFIIHKDVHYVHTVMRALKEGIEKLGQQMKSDWRVVNCTDERFDCLGSMVNSHGARMHRKTRRSAEQHMKVCIEQGDPIMALRTWSGIRGTFNSLSINNLLRYWRDRYEDFFLLVKEGRRIERRNARRRKWHKKLNKILISCPDCRSDENKRKYPLAA